MDVKVINLRAGITRLGWERGPAVKTGIHSSQEKCPKRDASLKPVHAGGQQPGKVSNSMGQLETLYQFSSRRSTTAYPRLRGY